MRTIYERPASDYPRMVFSDTDQINLDESQYVPEMSIPEVAKRLPKSRVYMWEKEPDARAGDIFVFRWARTHHQMNGKVHTIEFPDVYIEFTANPQRHTSARYWYAPFVLHGLEKTEYLAHKAGTTTNRFQALDEDAPHVKVEKDPVQVGEEDNVRSIKRRRPGKRERIRKAA